MMQKTHVWDIYIRLFHWALAVSVITCYVALEINDIELHMTAGSIALGLIIFRLLWGVVGSQTALFWDFIKGPIAIFEYLKTGYSKSMGHSPVGALSVVALLGMVGFQTVAGLFASAPDSFIYGPMANEVSSSTSKWFTGWHKFNGYWLQYLIGLHILAILFYKFFKKQGLTVPMITGFANKEIAAERSLSVGHIKAAVAIIIAAVISYMVGFF